MIKHTLPLAVAALGIALALTGCGTHSSASDPASTDQAPGTRAATIKEPHGFRNVTFSCFGANGVYVTSAGADDSLPSSVFVVPDDVNCK